MITLTSYFVEVAAKNFLEREETPRKYLGIVRGFGGGRKIKSKRGSDCGVANIIDVHMLGNSATLKTAVCLFYIGNEGISIVENAEKLNVPIPKFLHGKFLSFTEENAKADIERKKHQNS